MNLVVAFEGSDGSGKTTLIELTARTLREQGLDVAVIGKSDSDETKPITGLIQSPQLSYHPAAEAMLKIAREWQRFSVAARSPVTLLDRGLVSITSVLSAQAFDLTPYAPMLAACQESVGTYATVLCDAPFDLAWQRMHDRARETGAALSKKELKGAEFNRRIHGAILDACEHGRFTGEVCRVDTWRSPPAATAAVVSRWINAFVEPRLAQS